MPTFVTFYAYAFEGSPTVPMRGWFPAPGAPSLITTRARTALGRALEEHVRIYRCQGMLHGREGIEALDVECEDAELIYDGDAGEELWWFTMYCARSVLAQWNPPALVREYLIGGSPSLREVAHKCAWAASAELADIPRLAARCAMYAASDDRPLLAAREACRLAGQIAGDRLAAVSALQERALASALLGATATYRARLATEAPFAERPSGSQLRDSAPTLDELPGRPTRLLAMG
jgi:hypothetical protein